MNKRPLFILLSGLIMFFRGTAYFDPSVSIPAGYNRVNQETYSVCIDGTIWNSAQSKCTCSEGLAALKKVERDRADTAYADWPVRVQYWGCVPFKGGDFRAMQAQISSFNTFQDLNMENANLEGINFDGKYMSGIFLRGAHLKGASFSGVSSLWAAIFINADLTNADFRNVGIQGAVFQGADLTGAHFEGKPNDQFVKAPYAWANFKGAKNIDKAHFTGADLTGVIWVDGHSCAPGSIGMCK